MLFTLEALPAKRGDALLLHHGDPDDPTLIVIDGGWNGVYAQSLRPRLEALRELRDPLPIRLLMVSHIDADHIAGVLDLTRELLEAREEDDPAPYEIESLWHNSFDDLLGAEPSAFLSEVQRGLGLASFGEADVAAEGRLSPHGALVLASVPQGQRLRKEAIALGIELNQPSDEGLILAGDGSAVDPPIADGLTMRVIGPPKARVDALREEWEEVVERARARAGGAGLDLAAFTDDSVFNLSSVVVLVEAEGKTMLLTGDARGDDVLAGAEAAGLFDDDGRLHVDVLKLPHHGSDRNVDESFFRRITADHYVFSGDGYFTNPEPATFELLFAGRELDRPFKLHLTYDPETYVPYRGRDYPLARLRDALDAGRAAGHDFEVVFPPAGEGIRIDLLDPLDF